MEKSFSFWGCVCISPKGVLAADILVKKFTLRKRRLHTGIYLPRDFLVDITSIGLENNEKFVPRFVILKRPDNSGGHLIADE